MGRGSFTTVATTALKKVWETGSAADIQLAMTTFINKYYNNLLEHAPYVRAQQT